MKTACSYVRANACTCKKAVKSRLLEPVCARICKKFYQSQSALECQLVVLIGLMSANLRFYIFLILAFIKVIMLTLWQTFRRNLLSPYSG